MKFGKVLQQSIQLSKQDWDKYWIDYKQLKGIVKECAHINQQDKLKTDKLKAFLKENLEKVDKDNISKSSAEKQFFRTLHAQIHKISDFFLKEQAKYMKQTEKIQEEYFTLKSTQRIHQEKTRLMGSCVDLYKELLLLENFAVMNLCAFSKILKKHDKWTGYDTRQKFIRQIVSKQPFSSYIPLLAMINKLEHIFMEATGSSIDQHEATVNHEENTNGKNINRGKLKPEDQVTLFKIHSLRDNTWRCVNFHY